jgi:hypothetical protein
MLEKALLQISRELREGKRLRGWQQLHSALLPLQIAALQNATACATAGEEPQIGALGALTRTPGLYRVNIR